MMEIGGTRTEYAVFTGLAASSIPFPTPPGTVYGGTLEWLGGNQWKLTVTHAGVDLSNLEWGTTSYGAFRSYLPEYAKSNYGAFDGYAEQYTIVSYSSIQDGGSNVVAINSNQNSALVRCNTETPQGKIVYPLATPVEYTLTIPDSEIKTLLGNNNIFADCGNINTITFRTH